MITFLLIGDNMNRIDIEFLDEYKYVENFCKQAYGEESVKAYINEMKMNSTKGRAYISNWDNKMHTLIHLKSLRNSITHDNIPQEVTEKDLFDIKRFYNELLTQQDPLTLLHKEIEKTRKKPQKFKLQEKQIQNNIKQSSYNYSSSNDDEYNNSKAIAVAFAAVAVVAILAVVFLFFHQ